MQPSAEFQAYMSRIWGDIQRDLDEQHRAKAIADPLAHKNSLMFDNASYRYYSAGRDGRGREVRYCYSVHRNVAGFFLGWREVVGKKGGKRDMWVSRRVKQRCIDIARRRSNAFTAKSAPLPPDRQETP